MLDAAGRKTVSKCSYNAFIPALSSVRLATAPPLGAAAAFLPINMAVAIGCGVAVGAAVSTFAPSSLRLRGHVAAAAAFGNMANFPLVVTHGLCSGAKARAALLPGAGSAKECADVASALVLAPVWVASVLQILLANALMARAGEAGRDAAAEPAASELAPLRRAGDDTAAAAAERGASGDGLVSVSSKLDKAALDGLAAADAAAAPLSSLARGLRAALRAAAAPPCASALAGLAVGLTPARRLFAGEKAPLGLVASVLETLGGAMIPCLLIVLGGELASAGRDALIDQPRRTVAAATGARLALMPALGAAWLATATALRLVPTSQPPLFLIVCLLAWSTPAAVVLSTLAVQHGAAPGVMAGLLLVSYAGGAVTLPLVITLLLGAIR